MIRNPKVFLFDEPLSNLDAPLRVQMRREIAELQRQLGIAAIYVTHDQAEAMALGNRIAVMDNGVIQQVARPRDLYYRPANLFVAGFIGSPPMNLFHGVIVSECGGLCFKSRVGQGDSPGIAVRLDGGMVPKLAGLVDKPVVLGLRAEEILPMEADTAAAAESAVEAAVSCVETLGSESHVHLLVGSQEFTASWRTDSASFARHARLVVKFGMKTACFFDPVSGAAIA
jgi:multiple sugar transport system ATP-binding protein